MKLTEFTSVNEQQQLDELLPAVGMGLAALARSAATGGGAALAKGAGALAAKGSSTLAKPAGTLAGKPATPTGQAAQNTAAAAEPGTQMGPIDIINAIKDPKIAQQLKAMKQKMPGSSLDSMVDPKGTQDQQKQIQDLSTALDTLKKNAGIR
jgi:hypothetical protein